MAGRARGRCELNDFTGIARQQGPRVLAALLRRFGGLDACEDAVQEALLAAATSWPDTGVPDNPYGWLYTAASRRLVDEIRSDVARRAREEAHARSPLPVEAPEHDDSLELLVLCCHPSLPRASQVALTLRAVGGLTTAEIARAFLMPEDTMTRRITRAKQAIQQAGSQFPGEPDSDRLGSALHVLFLIFNEGYAASAGERLVRRELTLEAIRLTRMARAAAPAASEVTGLLALMLLAEARGHARLDDDGDIITLDQQDRSRWEQSLVAEGVALAEQAVSQGPAGPYQLLAAISALHTTAAAPEETDWPQILALYELLDVVAPNPMAGLGKVIAIAEVHGPQRALAALADLGADPRLAHHQRFLATRAHLLDQLGDHAAARAEWTRAAASPGNAVERRWLARRADRLT